MRIGDKELINHIAFFHRRRLLTLTAAALSLVVRELLALNVAVTCHGHHHFTARN